MATLADLNSDIREVRLHNGLILVIKPQMAFWTMQGVLPEHKIPRIMEVFFKGPNRVSLAVEHYNECFPKAK